MATVLGRDTILADRLLSSVVVLRREALRRTVRLGLVQGAAELATLGLAESFLIPYALSLGTSPSFVGLLAAVPMLAAALGQLLSEPLVQLLGSRRRVLLLLGGLGCLTWLAALLLPLLPVATAPWVLLGLATLGAASLQLGWPVWGSWVSQLVPVQLRGRYLGRRAALGLAASLVLVVAGGAMLEGLSATRWGAWGFAGIFGAALLLRAAAVFCLWRMVEPHAPRAQGRERYLHQVAGFLRGLHTTNIGRFILLAAAFQFGVYVAAPFFSVYLLQGLQTNYLVFALLTEVDDLIGICVAPFWGRLVDRRSNLWVLRFVMGGAATVPLLWLASGALPYLFLIQALSGLAWTGLNLALLGFLYEGARSEERTRVVAVYFACTGVAAFLGSLVGASLVDRLPPLFGHATLSVMLVSGLLRFAAVGLLLASVRDVRPAARRIEAPVSLAGILRAWATTVHLGAILPTRAPYVVWQPVGAIGVPAFAAATAGTTSGRYHIVSGGTRRRGRQHSTAGRKLWGAPARAHVTPP